MQARGKLESEAWAGPISISRSRAVEDPRERPPSEQFECHFETLRQRSTEFSFRVKRKPSPSSLNSPSGELRDSLQDSSNFSLPGPPPEKNAAPKGGASFAIEARG